MLKSEEEKATPDTFSPGERHPPKGGGDNQRSFDPLVPGRGTKSYTTYTDFMDLVVQYCCTKSLFTRESRRDLVQWCCTIFQKPSVIDVFFELVELRATTSKVLRGRLDHLSRRSIFLALEFLESKGLVVKARPLSTKGRPTTVYALLGYAPDDIIKAADNDRLLRTSGYAESKRITQLLLDDYFEAITKSYKGMTVVVKKKVIEIIKKESGGYDHEFLWKLICPTFTQKGYAIEI